MPGQIGIKKRFCSMCGGNETVEFYPDGTQMRGGDNDEELVKKMQEALNEQGYDCGTPDGKFGKNTEKAVKAFQEANGIVADGIAWPEVLELLLGDDYNAPETETPVAPEAPGNPEEIVDPEGTEETDPEGEETPAENLDVAFSKQAANAPANGEYFVAGENIVFTMLISNNGESDMTNVVIRDAMKGAGDEAVVDTIESIAPGSFAEAYFYYIVTAEDEAKGAITGQAELTWTDGTTGEEFSCMSNMVNVLCGAVEVNLETIAPSSLSLIDVNCMKSVLSTPMNGEYFVPGEMITFEVYMNYQGEAPLHDVVGFDPLMEAGNGRYEFGNVAPRSHGGFMFEYIVTDMDAVAGKIVNVAIIEGYNENGERVAGCSNTVIVPAGYADAATAPVDAIEITLEVTSLPANKLCYKAGEVVSYAISYTNTSGVDLSNVNIYCTANGTAVVDSVETLAAGEKRDVTFDYSVLPADMKRGYVGNMAIAQYFVDGKAGVAFSNIISSDADGNPNTNYREGDEGAIDAKGLKTNASTMISQDGCQYRIATWNGEAAEYELYYCTAHATTKQNADAAIAAASDAQAWESVAGMWASEVNSMYNLVMQSSDGAAKVTVITDHMQFVAHAGAYKAQLTAQYADQPAYVAQMMAEMYKAKALEMCFEAHNASKERSDSILYATRLPDTDATAAVCSREAAATETGEKITLHACEEHALVLEMTYARLDSDKSEAAWLDIRTMWEIELSGAYNDLYAKGGAGWLADYATFDAWLEAHEAYLNLLYPEQPEVVAEIIVREIIERVFYLHTIG